MTQFTTSSLVLLCVLIAAFISAQTTADGYVGYSLTAEGDPESVVYATNSTTPNVSTSYPEPDVFLNATLHVGEIDLTVTNITAKINLEAQVLSLLSFNAGVSASIDQVKLLIQDVDAEVLLEARLGNLLLMIGDVLDSLDLNPVLATLGKDVGQIVNTTVGAVTGSTSSTSQKRSSYNVAHNILYSVNDYTGQTHTNRVLAHNGSIIDQSIDNDGHVYSETIQGYYLQDMTFNGYNKTVTGNSLYERELEYVYAPFPGLQAVCAIFMNGVGQVVKTQVLSEASGGGSSTVGGGEDL